MESVPRISVDTVMSRQLVACTSDTTVPDAKRLADDFGVHYLVLRDGDEFVGVVSTSALSEDDANVAVGRHALLPPVYVNAGAPLRRARDIMVACRVGCLPVIDERGDVVGVVTRHDIRVAGGSSRATGFQRCVRCGARHTLERYDGIVFCRACAPNGEEH